MRVADIGEFGLIDRLRKRLGPCDGPGVVLPNGDDCAGLVFSPGRWVLATSDILVEGEHFIRSHCPPRQIGRKALAINLSDVAAMGGDPKFALVSIAVPEDTPCDYLEEVYDGLREQGEEFGTVFVGGNVSRCRSGIVLDVHLLGEGDPEATLRRSGAQPGDVLMVTGTLGDAAAGLRLLLQAGSSRGGGKPAFAPSDESLVDAFLGPRPLVREGRAIARAGAATAMIDVSDGLSGDVSHLCEASRVGVTLDAGEFPLSDALRDVAPRWDLEPEDLALQGGEDYELLVAVRPDEAEGLAARLFQETGTNLRAIGRFTEEGAGRNVVRNGREVPLVVTSYDHLRRGGG
ncbi:MAG: thiamine-phosphate kinase [Nitrospinota bacterium]